MFNMTFIEVSLILFNETFIQDLKLYFMLFFEIYYIFNIGAYDFRGTNVYVF